MAEPLSFVASVVAVAALAEKVVTRGYSYLKAVKNCPDEVRNLMAEANVLCGILSRLCVLLAGNESNSNPTIGSRERVARNSDNNDESSDEEDVLNSEDEVVSASDNGTGNSPNVSAMLPITYALSSASTSRLHP